MLLAVLFLAALFPANGKAATGPSSSEAPYLVPSAPGVDFTSILTTGDSVQMNNAPEGTPYVMWGTPDGLGAYDNGGGVFTLLMNHEFSPGDGVARAHGADGSFISKWEIRKRDLTVLNGEDLITDLMLWDGWKYVDGTGTALSRFCSADLPAVTAFFNSGSGKGYNEGRIFMNGEEDSGATHGRALAHVASGLFKGTTYELPDFERHPWENLLASPFEQDLTVVAGDEDGSIGTSGVFIYVGEKKFSGSPIERAGLTGGDLYEVKVGGNPTEATIPHAFSGPFSLMPTGSGTGFNRVEDGAWDTTDPNRYYFVTTDTFGGNSRLWALDFADITDPTAGGTIRVVIDGDTVKGQKIEQMDNITVDTAGTVYMQEDVGHEDRLGQIWKYDPQSNKITNLAEHDAALFGVPAGPDFLTTNEESSGVIEVTNLLEGVEGYNTVQNRYFLLVVQNHKDDDGYETYVEGGQLLLMTAPYSGGPNDGHGN